MAVIRVSGNPGSGKTTLCRRLADYLGYVHHYTGGIFREMAREKNLSIEEFYAEMASNPDLEKTIDERQAELMRKNDNLVVEGRIAPFQPSPYKTVNILIKVDPEEGARRRMGEPENGGKSLEEILLLTEARIQNEREHYKAIYGIDDHLSEKYFDFVLDTTNLSPDEVFERAKDFLDKNSARVEPRF